MSPFCYQTLWFRLFTSQMVVVSAPLWLNKKINNKEKNKLLSASDSFRCYYVGSFSFRQFLTHSSFLSVLLSSLYSDF